MYWRHQTSAIFISAIVFASSLVGCSTEVTTDSEPPPVEAVGQQAAASILDDAVCLGWKANPLYLQGLVALAGIRGSGAITRRSQCHDLAEDGSAALSSLLTLGLTKSALQCACDDVFPKEDGDPPRPTFLSGDFNGDQKKDTAVVYKSNGGISIDVYVNANDHFVLEHWATEQGGWVDEGIQFFVGDFDGDGRDDIGQAFNDYEMVSMAVHRSTGNDFEMYRQFTRQTGWVHEGMQFVAGSFDTGALCNPRRHGGRVEFSTCSQVAQVYNDWGRVSIEIFQGTTETASHRTAATQIADWIPGYMHFAAGRFHGRSSYMDIASIFNDWGYASIDVYSKRGTSQFTKERWATQQGGWVDAGMEFVVGDFNGDRYDDIAYAYNDWDMISFAVELNWGNRFEIARWATQQGGWVPGMQFVGGDFNLDGYADVAGGLNDWNFTSIDNHFSSADRFGSTTRWIRQGGYPVF